MAVDAAAIDPASTRDALYSVVGSFTRDALLYGDERRRLKEKCEERLSCTIMMPWKRLSSEGESIEYAEQAILADLEWGIGALEEALCACSIDTKNAWLEHAEKMLQVCVLLDPEETSAGIPNSYLAAWAHLYLAFVWKLRNDDTTSLKHVLDMFLVDPLYSRLDFAPKLWEHLFLPHLSSVVGWFDEQRSQVTSIHSSTAQEVAITTEEETQWLQHIEQLFETALDDYTRLYARYYTDCLTFDAAKRKAIPLIPIAEPPATPLYDPSPLRGFTSEIHEEEEAASICYHLQYKISMENHIHQPARYDFRSSEVELIQENLESVQEGLLTNLTATTRSSEDNQWNYADGADSPPSLANMVQAFAPRLSLKDEIGEKSIERPKRLIDFLQETMQGPSGSPKTSEPDCHENNAHLQLDLVAGNFRLAIAEGRHCEGT